MTWRIYGEALALKRAPNSANFAEAAGYLPDQGLIDAVDVAISLGQPLLLTGEPGSGKTQLAHSLSFQLFASAPIIFNTKTTSTARDLFYQYDALRHFRDAQLHKADGASSASDYISFEALGLAILLSQPRGEVAEMLPAALRANPEGKSVVLIDEIDKAPRDLPNDVLNEIERMEFSIKETGRTFRVDNAAVRPVVVLTSNSEKLLPDAFLRRCVYYHLPFPDTAQLRKIVTARLGDDSKRPWIVEEIRKFEAIRALPIKKKPATAELLAWLRILEQLASEQKDGDPALHPVYKNAIAVLLKDKDSQDTARKVIAQ
ncbi:MAG: MoxR family ATPase [Gemmatimonadaceae bacterium]